MPVLELLENPKSQVPSSWAHGLLGVMIFYTPPEEAKDLPAKSQKASLPGVLGLPQKEAANKTTGKLDDDEFSCLPAGPAIMENTLPCNFFADLQET